MNQGRLTGDAATPIIGQRDGVDRRTSQQLAGSESGKSVAGETGFSGCDQRIRHATRQRDQHRQPRQVYVQPSADELQAAAAAGQERFRRINSSAATSSVVPPEQISDERSQRIPEPQEQRKLGKIPTLYNSASVDDYIDTF